MSDREIWSLSHAQCAAVLRAVRNERERIEGMGRGGQQPGPQATYADRQQSQVLKQILGLYGSKSYERH